MLHNQVKLLKSPGFREIRCPVFQSDIGVIYSRASRYLLAVNNRVETGAVHSEYRSLEVSGSSGTTVALQG